MLNRTLAPLRGVSWSWAHASVLLVGLMWVFPFLHYRHEIPLTTFDQEWWSAVLGVAAMTLLLSGSFWQQPVVPRIAQLPALLVVIALVQSALGRVVYWEQGLLYVLYFLFAALLMVLGARLRANFGIERLALALAAFLVLGAEMEATTGFLQHYRWDTWFSGYIIMKINSGVYGNLAQPNHFANYLTLGLISIGLLYQQRKLPWPAVVVLVTPLLFVIALSGSRSPWLYFITMTVLAWFWVRRDQGMRPLLKFSIGLLLGHMAMIFIVQLPFLAGSDTMDVSRRMFQDHASWGIRLYLWKEAASIFLSSPGLGVGFGQYAVSHMQWLPILQPHEVTGLYNHAHNLLMQVAAEAGLSGIVVLLGGLLMWLRGALRGRCTAAHWWGYSAVAVLAIHSCLEYPLWYAYFVGVLGILMGMLDETHYELELRRLGRLAVGVILLLGATSLWQLERDYHGLKRALSVPPENGNVLEARKKTVQGLLDIHIGSLMYPYAQMYLSTFREAKVDEYLKQKIAANMDVMRFAPMPIVVFQQAILLAMDGQADAAKKVLREAVWSYPGDVAGYQRLLDLAEQDPARFEPLVEFINQQEEERAGGIHQQ